VKGSVKGEKCSAAKVKGSVKGENCSAAKCSARRQSRLQHTSSKSIAAHVVKVFSSARRQGRFTAQKCPSRQSVQQIGMGARGYGEHEKEKGEGEGEGGGGGRAAVRGRGSAPCM
jgi:hypothetical protein